MVQPEVHVTGRLTYKWPSSVIVHSPSPSISKVLDVNDQDKSFNSKVQRCNGEILRVYLSWDGVGIKKVVLASGILLQISSAQIDEASRCLLGMLLVYDPRKSYA